MNKAEFPYEKAPAAKSGTFIRASLWLGEDHILAVRNQRFREEYTRFYYADIKAIELRRAARFGFPAKLWWLVVALLIAWPLLLPRHAPPYLVPLLLLAVLLWFLYRSLFQSCVCHIVTRVGIEQLPALQRTAPSIKTVALLRTRIEAAQQELPDEWERAYETQPLRSSASAGTFAGDRTPVSRAGTVWAAASLFFVTGDAAITSIQIGLIRLPVPRWLGNTNLLLLIVAGVTAFLLLRGTRSRSLRLSSLICVLFVGSVSYGSEMLGNFMQAFQRSDANNSFVNGIAGLNSLLGVVNIGGDLVLLIVGAVILLRTFQRNAPGNAE